MRQSDIHDLLRLFRQHAGRPGRAGYLLQDRAGVYRQPPTPPTAPGRPPGRDGPRDRVHRQPAGRASPAEIIYTSGASEANNLALKGIAQASRHIGKHIISTQLEHSSVGASLSVLQQQGYEIDLLNVNRDGKADLAQLRELLRKDTILVAVCAVDSEIGTVQPVKEIAEIVKQYPDCRLHVDATQAVGKTDLWFDGVDTMSFTAHKFYGPNGIGALYKRRGLVIEPQISGGASTTIYRSGTPTLGLAAALEASLTKALAEQPQRIAHVQHLHDRLAAALQAYPEVRFNSPAGAVPHILNVSVNGIKATRFQQALSEQGVCVSVKSACSSDGHAFQGRVCRQP